MMTREEAISILNNEIGNADRNIFPEVLIALDMAIKALSAEPCRDMEEIEEVINCDADAKTKCKMIFNILTAKPHYFKEQEPCENAISRQAVLELAKNECETAVIPYKRFVKLLNALPPVTPKPKTEVLDKIKAEIHATAELHEDGDYYLRDKWIDKIFDKYKAESEG